jgi:simple sugar transport system permease protein
VTRTALTPLAGSLLAIVAAFLTGGLFLLIVGKDPFEAYRLLVSRSLGSSLGITESLIRMAPLLFVAAGLLIALKAGVWNIGVDGQFLIGAILVGVTAPELIGDLPRALVLLVSAVVGFAGGVAWAVVPALLKVRYGLNEIITTIMMNYVAINLTSWLVKGPFKDPDVVPPQTVLIPRADRLPTFGLSRVHIGLLFGLLAVLLVVFLYRFTTLGFKFWVLGQNRRAAVHAGLPVGGLTVLALLLSGGCAGLAGANDVLGVKGLFQGNWFPNYGFTGFALVYLARLNGLWVIPFALFFSFLAIGGEFMSRAADIPTYFVELLEGLMLGYFAVAVYVERRYLGRAATRRQVATRLEPEAVESI